MINSSSLMKYILYAIGEIALIIIGILIALQISDHNEQLKERAFETKMLNEIRTQLESDTSYFNMLISRCTRIDTSIQHILEFYDSGATDRQYFKSHADNIQWGYIFEYNAGAYEALKSSGVEKISDDQLRKELISLYDFWLPRTKHILMLFRSPEFHMHEEDLERRIYGLKIELEEDGRRDIDDGLYNLEKLDDPLFLEYLDLKHKQAVTGLSRIKYILIKIESVLDLLNRHLKH